jgi:hypothetical protein
MSVPISFFLISLACLQLGIYAQQPIPYSKLENSHDILLSPWGPYSKKYAGISHINNMQSGMRFDVSVFPGYYRNRVLVPNVLVESSYYPWNISADMSQITYRYELEWKDKVYVDVTYSVLDSTSVLVAMRCVNNTSINQALSLNLISYINYPDIYPSVKAIIPEPVTWINAVDYIDLKFARPRPSDNLVYDGWLRAEVRNADYIDGRAVGKDFGANKGDKVIYKISNTQKNGIIRIYYRVKENTKTTFRATGLVNQSITFIGTGKFTITDIPYSLSGSDNENLVLISEGGTGIELNGLFIGAENDVKNITITPLVKNYTPVIASDDSARNLRLKYENVNTCYGVAWNFSPAIVRALLNDELDFFFRRYVHEHVQTRLVGNKQGYYANTYMRPVELAPNSDQTIYGFICNGDEMDVKQKLADFNLNPQIFIQRVKIDENPFKRILPEGEKYVFSQKMMRAAVLSNVVYPIYTQNQYIRHFTPGKWWNSLYTWDSGFEALGLAEIDINKAIQNLNAYTTPVGSQSAFIHHGSPVPVQMYAFYDLWNKTQSKEFLTYFYPRMKQYYEFMAGKAGSSTTAAMNSKILKTWDYFYNSGGWDDYPPQVEVHRLKLEDRVSPVITTAHCIRSAKILRKAAEVLNKKEDIKDYDKDVKTFANALQTYSWDEKSGYFSYVVHDSLKNPLGILKHRESGQNLNMGLDGAYPLFSGICTQKQQEILLEKIFSDKHMWTPAGICVVDQAAPYYRIDGYWNGAVWMSHQWFVWKTMFDLGRTDLAFKIADKALEIWKKETDETYYTFEHFFAKTGRGAGWHQFAALSTPVMMWFSAYYKPGTITTGFEVWIDRQSFDSDFTQYEASLSFDNTTPAHTRSIMACMNPSFKYKVSVNGKETSFFERNNGLLEIKLPAANNGCILHIRTIQ